MLLDANKVAGWILQVNKKIKKDVGMKCQKASKQGVGIA